MAMHFQTEGISKTPLTFDKNKFECVVLLNV